MPKPPSYHVVSALVPERIKARYTAPVLKIDLTGRASAVERTLVLTADVVCICNEEGTITRAIPWGDVEKVYVPYDANDIAVFAPSTTEPPLSVSGCDTAALLQALRALPEPLTADTTLTNAEVGSVLLGDGMSTARTSPTAETVGSSDGLESRAAVALEFRALTSRLTSLSDATGVLRRQVLQERSTRKEVEDEFAQCKVFYGQLERQHSEKMSAMTELQRQLEEKERRVSELRQLVECRKDEMVNTNFESERLATLLEESSEKAQEVRDGIVDQDRKLQQLGLRIKELKGKAVQSEAALAARRGDVLGRQKAVDMGEAEKRKLDGMLANLRAEVHTRELRSEQAKKDVAEMKERLQKAHLDVTKLGAELELVEAERLALSELSESLRREYENGQVRLEELKKQSEALKKEVLQKNDELHSFKSTQDHQKLIMAKELQEKEEALQTAEQQLRASLEAVKVVNSERVNAKHILHNMQIELENADSRLKEVKSAVEAKDERTSSLMQTLDLSRKGLQQNKMDLNEKIDVIESKTEILHERSAEVSQWDKKIEEITEEIQSLIAHEHETRERVSGADAEIQTVNNDIRRLNNRVRILQQELVEAKALRTSIHAETVNHSQESDARERLALEKIEAARQSLYLAESEFREARAVLTQSQEYILKLSTQLKRRDEELSVFLQRLSQALSLK